MFLSLFTFLTGCTYLKRKALDEYTQSLRSDLLEWEAIKVTASQVDSNTERKVFMSYIDTLMQSLNEIVKSAEERNASITDPEIKEIDDYYVQYAKDMRSSFSLMYEAFDEYDQSKLDLSKKQALSSVENIKNYINAFQDYMDKYGIQDDSDISSLMEELEALE